MTANFKEELWRWIMKNGFAAFLLCSVCVWGANYIVSPLMIHYQKFVDDSAHAIRMNADTSRSQAESLAKLTSIQLQQAGMQGELIELARRANDSDQVIIKLLRGQVEDRESDKVERSSAKVRAEEKNDCLFEQKNN